MPAQERVRLDNDQCLFPRAEPAGQQYQQSAVASGEFRPLCLPLQDDQLLAQKDVLEYQL